MEIKQNKLSLDKLLLNDAIRLEHLPKGSKFEDLTPQIKQKMIDEKAFSVYNLDGTLKSNV
ncbi:MAG: hypothetical protein QF568_00490 [Flavobacteriales bacterium]|jgi:hypothetical protein|nr:hypothetical protein [Flavobacteriales bacterium]|tara:strand:- start:2260 stop:2442 length:183 start_codon:yes stop_codon:yes gene_type:complete